jgi:hypothetical protein
MDDARTPPEMAHPGTDSAPTTSSPSMTTCGNNGNAQLPLRPGHELPFVAPSSYLRPKPTSRTMSERTPTALDKDQMQGLVSSPPLRVQLTRSIRPVASHR